MDFRIFSPPRILSPRVWALPCQGSAVFQKGRKMEKMLKTTRYTKEAWEKIFPKKSLVKWKRTTNPGNIREFVESYIELLLSNKHKLDGTEKISVVTIDEEYFNWLEDNDKQDSEKAREEYAYSINDDEAFHLLCKHKENNILKSIYIPFVIFLPDGHFSGQGYQMSDETCNGLKAYFEGIFGNGNVYVPQYYFSCSSSEGLDLDDVDMLCGAYFNDGVKVRYDKYLFQHFENSGVNMAIFYVTVCVRKKIESAVFNVMDFLTDMAEPIDIPEFIVLNADEYPFFGEFYPEENIKHDFGDVNFTFPACILEGSSINDYERKFLKGLKKTSKNNQDVYIQVV